MSRSAVRVLGDEHEPDVLALCDRDPVAHCFLAGRVSRLGCHPMRLGGQLWGYFEGSDLLSVVWAGANLVPVEVVPQAVGPLAERALRHGRRCSSIVGPAAQTLALWELLEPEWGPARAVRLRQPLMVIDHDPAIEPDPGVQSAQVEDLELLLPACIHMFTEEVGYSPVAGDGGALYRRRVQELVERGRSLVSFAQVDGRRQVAFKAEIGATSDNVVQIQGVWVNPALRGSGLAAPGMAAVVRYARRDRPITVSLYVNDFNTAALATYRRTGFRTVGSFATVIF